MACLGKANGRRRKGQTTRIESACQVCAKRIEVIPALVGRKKYCSHRCNAIGVHMSGSNRPRTSKIADASIAAWSGQGAGSLAWKAEHRVSRWTIDLAFPDLMLAVELDGVYWHSRPKQIEKDRIRDAALRERGWTVLRIPMEEGATAPKIAKRIGTAVQQHISRKALVA
jgi:very-short-patch-repair endonuclease